MREVAFQVELVRATGSKPLMSSVYGARSFGIGSRSGFERRIRAGLLEKAFGMLRREE
jgi:hypothetical protein